MTWGTRRRLPNRRLSQSFDFDHGLPGQEQMFHAAIGYFPDGTPGEVFITRTKASGDLQIVAHEASIAISLALQYGATIEELLLAMPKEDPGITAPPDALGPPQGIMGRLLSLMNGMAHEHELTEQPVAEEATAANPDNQAQ